MCFRSEIFISILTVFFGRCKIAFVSVESFKKDFMCFCSEIYSRKYFLKFQIFSFSLFTSISVLIRTAQLANWMLGSFSSYIANYRSSRRWNVLETFLKFLYLQVDLYGRVLSEMCRSVWWIATTTISRHYLWSWKSNFPSRPHFLLMLEISQIKLIHTIQKGYSNSLSYWWDSSVEHVASSFHFITICKNIGWGQIPSIF